MNAPIYDPNFPSHPSRSSWRCAPAALWWAFGSYGFLVSNGWLERALLDADLMVPKLGMTDKSGRSIADWVNRHVGGLGFVADSKEWVEFPDVAERAGSCALLLYGKAWGHWVGVRSAERDLLRLANPNPGFVSVYDALPAAAYELLGPFNLVTIERPSFRRAYRGQS
jgi:hypothetical protein